MSPRVSVLVSGRNSPFLCLLSLLSVCLSPDGRSTSKKQKPEENRPNRQHSRLPVSSNKQPEKKKSTF